MQFVEAEIKYMCTVLRYNKTYVLRFMQNVRLYIGCPKLVSVFVQEDNLSTIELTRKRYLYKCGIVAISGVVHSIFMLCNTEPKKKVNKKRKENIYRLTTHIWYFLFFFFSYEIYIAKFLMQSLYNTHLIYAVYVVIKYYEFWLYLLYIYV